MTGANVRHNVMSTLVAGRRPPVAGVFVGSQGQTLSYWNVFSPSGEVLRRIDAGI